MYPALRMFRYFSVIKIFFLVFKILFQSNKVTSISYDGRYLKEDYLYPFLQQISIVSIVITQLHMIKREWFTVDSCFQYWLKKLHTALQSPLSLKRESPQTHVLYFQILINAIFGSFSAQSRLFESTKRGFCGGDQTFVDPNHAHFHLLRHPPDLTDVSGVKVT